MQTNRLPGAFQWIRKQWVRNWLSRVTAAVILFLSVSLAMGEEIHRHLLDWGEKTWDEYFTLRNPASYPEPSCTPPPGMKRGEASKADPGHTESLVCARKWQRYQTIQDYLTPALRAFAWVETSVAAVVTTFGGHRRSLLVLLAFLVVCVSLFQRRAVSILPVRSHEDHRVQAFSVVVISGFLSLAAYRYQLGKARHAVEIATVESEPFDWFWVLAFGCLALFALARFLRPSDELPSEGYRGRTILVVPLFAVLCLLISVYAMTIGEYHGYSVLFGMFNEMSGTVLELLLAVWFLIWVTHRAFAD